MEPDLRCLQSDRKALKASAAAQQPEIIVDRQAPMLCSFGTSAYVADFRNGSKVPVWTPAGHFRFVAVIFAGRRQTFMPLCDLRL